MCGRRASTRREQIEAWKRITDAVHAKGGLIFLQLMHTGRISHPSLLPDQATPVAPSAIAAEGKVFTASGPQDFVVPRALETEEIPGIIEEYRTATRHALEAGFDGVELHAASAICRNSSSPRGPISARTITAVRWRTARGSSWTFLPRWSKKRATTAWVSRSRRKWALTA